MKCADLCRKHGMSQGTFYNWKAKFGGMTVSEGRDCRTIGEEVLLFRPVCSLVKMDQGFIQAAILMGTVLLSYASFGVNIPWIECGRSAL